MSDEQRSEENEVEAHHHPKYSANDEPRDEAEDNEVEAHHFHGGKVSKPRHMD